MDTVLYVGCEEGVVSFRSPDGRSWQQEGHELRSWAVPKVATVPGAPDKVLAGTRGDGVWLSEDFGKSWKKPSYGRPGPGKVRALVTDASAPGRVYAGCEPIDVFVSEDLGQNWVRFDSVWDEPFVPTVTYPVAVVEPHVRDIVIDPADPNTVYAALQVGYILKSTDGGETWHILQKNYDCDVHTIVIDPRNRQHIMIATGGHDSRGGKVQGRALYASSDGGEAWTPAAMNFSQEYSVPLAMNPNDPNVLFSGLAHGQPNSWRRETGAESLMVRSRDGGQSWQDVSKGLEAASRDFPEAIVVDPEQTDTIYAGFRKGDFYASRDGGDSWEKLDIHAPSVADLRLVHA
jgi:photosystem II stability/assembly factor-like uncharacterized protein